MCITDIHTLEPCGHTGMRIPMVSHMQSRRKAHEKPCDHMVIAGGSHVNTNYKCLVTCKAHEKPCDHMVISSESHVDLNNKCLFSCRAW